MSDISFIITFVLYVLVAWVAIYFLKRWTAESGTMRRILVRSFGYALFLGIGIAGTGGEPGFALPAPNVVALLLMAADGFSKGVYTGLLILGFWWMLLFVIMWLNHYSNNRRVVNNSLDADENSN